jgi:aminocarboxymuconate-semialdehyde decarboxylase
MIDVHTHYVPRGWPDPTAGSGRLPWLRIESESEAVIMMGSQEFRRIRSSCWDAEIRLAEMDSDGVEAQVVMPTPVFFSYTEEPVQASRIARVFNDLALEICAPAPARLLPFCQVPLQDPEAACQELERCAQAGHVGVEIGNHVGDRDLDDEGVVTFLQHAASLDMPVFVHPWDMSTTPRMDRWMAQWLTGMPAETHLSIVAMTLGGVFDHIGEELRICFAHGGGSFAFWVGRMDNAWRHRRDVVGLSSDHPPSHYLGRFYVDSAVFDERPLRLLLETVGPDRVILGSDYPYPLGEQPVGAVIRSAGLDDATQEQLLHHNAQVFLGGRAAAQLHGSRRIAAGPTAESGEQSNTLASE